MFSSLGTVLLLSGLWLHRSRAARMGEPAATGYFSQEEFEALNCGIYHDCDHALRVAELMREVAAGFRVGEERALFLGQVSLIHDADPSRPRGTPARVPSTLVWLDEHRDSLGRKFGWTDALLLEARALVARTEYPFCPERKSPDPVAAYRDCLVALAPDRRPQVMVEALMLRFVDQLSFYLGSFEEAAGSVCRLANEFHNAGLPCGLGPLWAHTAEFLTRAGEDVEHDRELAESLQLSGLALPGRAELLASLSRRRRRNLERVIRRFEQGSRDGWRV